ncbi:hypothetical protein B296_00057240 [Ensete ventricosum]|uniref:Uncharacterized protein n=1 Tax=Ensete ventricosum TaxID=4639 RepID=A0A426XGN2_ENSVE|nr:hypothetical protein B296_00057240 [Ensete ventricosum]
MTLSRGGWSLGGGVEGLLWLFAVGVGVWGVCGGGWIAAMGGEVKGKEEEGEDDGRAMQRKSNRCCRSTFASSMQV